MWQRISALVFLTSVTVAIAGRDPALGAQATKLAERWLADRSSISPDLINAVLETSASFGDRALYERLRLEATKTKDPDDIARLLDAMSQFTNSQIVKENFELFSSGPFDGTESFRLLLGPRFHPATRNIPLEFVGSQYAKVLTRLPPFFAARLPIVASEYCDERSRAQVERFFKDKSSRAEGGPRILAQTLDSITLLHREQESPAAGGCRVLEAVLVCRAF